MNPADWLDTLVRITRDGVYFGEIKVPGIIAEDGITIKPGGKDINKMTVEFLVGKVFVEDPMIS